MKITFTSSFDANLHSPHNAGFFSSILRRLLCSGSLRTHPFYCVKDDSVVHHSEEKTEGSATPGIVARLMGLETMPTNGIIKDSICRSRSANAVEYRLEYDLSVEQRRRLKSSSSFREIPSFLKQEDDEFLVFSFGNTHERKQRRKDGDNKNRENRMRNQEDRNQKNCREKSGKCRRKVANRPSQSGRDCDRVHHPSSDTSNKKKGRRNGQASTKLKSPVEIRDKKGHSEESNSPSATEKAEIRFDIENSSPVSVLDLIEFVSEPESPLSEDGSRLKSSNSRRKLSTHLANFEQLSSNFSHTSTTEVKASKNSNVQVTGSRNRDCYSEDYCAVWVEVSKLAEEDLQRSNWSKRDVSKMDGYEEIRVEFGLQILDQLLYELVAELVVV